MKTNYHTYKNVLKFAYERNCKAQTDYVMMARYVFTTDNLAERLTMEQTEELFSYAEKQNLRILIHTGASGDDSPKRFEYFIKAHPNGLVQLAHLKDLDAQEYMLKKYPNVVVDSPFAGENEIGALVGDGIERKRILWGTDMPVTYWWYNVLGKEKIPSIGKEVLTEFYKRNHYPAASQSL